MMDDVLVCDVVAHADPGGARVVIVELPRGQRTIPLHAGSDLDQRGRPEIRERELLLARPDEPHGPVRGACEPRRLDGGFTGVLAAVTGTGVRNDDAHVR